MQSQTLMIKIWKIQPERIVARYHICKRVPTGYCAEHTEDALHTIVYAILKPLRTNHKQAGDPPLTSQIVISSVLLHTEDLTVHHLGSIKKSHKHNLQNMNTVIG